MWRHYCSVLSCLMDIASLASVALVSALSTFVSTNSTKRWLNESHCVLPSASCSHEFGSPTNSFVLNCRSNCAQCACGLPLPVGLMCNVAALLLSVPLFLAAFPAHFQWRRRAVTCHLSICCLCVVLATFLAESVWLCLSLLRRLCLFCS